MLTEDQRAILTDEYGITINDYQTPGVYTLEIPRGMGVQCFHDKRLWADNDILYGNSPSDDYIEIVKVEKV